MLLGRVVGCVWSTVKDSHLEGQRLLLVQPMTPELKPTGKRLVCADWTGAGTGELVYLVFADQPVQEQPLEDSALRPVEITAEDGGCAGGVKEGSRL